MGEFSEIRVDVEGHVACVTMDRPDRLNALGMNLAEEFNALALELAEEREVRAVVLTGGGRAFCTGRDLKESATHTKEDADRYQLLGMEAVTRWEKLPMPTIAAINGPSFGWGMEISLACDIRLVAEDAILCFPECALGIFPGAGGTVRLPRLIPAGTAKEIIYTAKRFDGNEAERIGLASKAIPKERLMEEAMAMATKIAENGPLGVRGAKKVIEHSLQMSREQAIEFSNVNRMPLNFTKDFAEALAAFKEKRKPVFRGE